MSERPIRDILAECMRRERVGLMRPLWEDWKEFADDECEKVRQRADHLMRLLRDYGVELVQRGAAIPPAPAPTSPVVWRYHLTDSQTERLVRKGAGDSWEIVHAADGKETVALTFTMPQLAIESGMVLTGDPEALKLKGLMTRLAAGLEIYRMDAATMEAPDAG